MTQAGLEARLEQFSAACREAGIKLTHQRIEIFREVAGSVEHPDADAVYRGVRDRMPTVSLDTVYRTLTRLLELGLITTLGGRRESLRYDANLGHHHHYVCVRCGRVRDFESAALDALRLPSGLKRFGNVVSTHVEVRGFCEACAKQEGRKTKSKRAPAGAGRKKER